MSNALVEKKFECFKINIEDKIAHIVLNRPEKMNSMPPSFGQTFQRLLMKLTKMH